MSNFKISAISAREILDSRGNPTISASIKLASGNVGIAAVPSGASTGKHEALELRDGGSRFEGKGVLNAIKNINDRIAPKLIGSVWDQKSLDSALIEIDGTPNKASLGANATLAVSLAFARASSLDEQIPLYQYIHSLTDERENNLPIPLMNLLNGGAHASNSTDLQEFMIIPVGAPNFSEAVRMGAETFHVLKKLLKSEGYVTSVGDEGGFAPKLNSNEQALNMLMEAIKGAGYKPGEEIALAIDAAASEFYKDGKYVLELDDLTLSAKELVNIYAGWCDKYPIISIEDGLAEDDWEGWRHLTQSLGESIQIVGDDLFATNTARIQEGITRKAANSTIIKFNQIGTLTETLAAIELAWSAGFSAIVSHRSGETEDTFISDLAVGTGSGQIKAGSLSHSDRTAKYNRLMLIETELVPNAKYSKWIR